MAWWWWGPVSSSCLFALSPSYLLQSRVSTPQLWPVEPGRRREETGGWDKGVEWGEEEEKEGG